MLISQAQAENLPIVTNERTLKPTAYAGFGETPSGAKDRYPVADRRVLIGRMGSPVALKLLGVGFVKALESVLNSTPKGFLTIFVGSR